ncbi:NmrA-like family protein, partial [Diaporthe helianthi]
ADAQALSDNGVEVVGCDTGDRSSIRAALDGAHAVFALTVSLYKPGRMEEELVQGKAIADEAVAAGAQFINLDVSLQYGGRDDGPHEREESHVASCPRPAVRPTLLNMLAYFEEFGYYGPHTEQLVGEAAQAAKGKPSGFDEYLRREPLQIYY